jgi:hypothetical protein
VGQNRSAVGRSVARVLSNLGYRPSQVAGTRGRHFRTAGYHISDLGRGFDWIQLTYWAADGTPTSTEERDREAALEEYADALIRRYDVKREGDFLRVSANPDKSKVPVGKPVYHRSTGELTGWLTKDNFIPVDQGEGK